MGKAIPEVHTFADQMNDHRDHKRHDWHSQYKGDDRNESCQEDVAEQVCTGEDVEDWEILDLLTSLVDKSLVASELEGEHTRYQLLETVLGLDSWDEDCFISAGSIRKWRNEPSSDAQRGVCLTSR